MTGHLKQKSRPAHKARDGWSYTVVREGVVRER
jgi:hypothetical protein